MMENNSEIEFDYEFPKYGTIDMLVTNGELNE